MFVDLLQVVLSLIAVVGISYLVVMLMRLQSIGPSEWQLQFTLAKDTAMFDCHLGFMRALQSISRIPDPVFRAAAIKKLDAIYEELTTLGRGTIVFQSTESWRLVYEQLLCSKIVYDYKSVAWIRDVNYWQNEPGQKSLKLCLELIDAQQLRMHRICILSDEMWPESQPLPHTRIVRWIEEHVTHGVPVGLIRESSLMLDDDLLVDMGVYGSHAVGHQLTSETEGTSKFVLQFDFDAVAGAEVIWKRLHAYAKDCKEIREQPP